MRIAKRFSIITLCLCLLCIVIGYKLTEFVSLSLYKANNQTKTSNMMSAMNMDQDCTKESSTPCHSHAILNVKNSEHAPKITHLVFPDKMDGYNIQLLTDNFRFTPASAGHAPEENTGHAHIYINGKKIMRAYSNWIHLPSHLFQPGTNLLSITLNANDHSSWAINNTPISSTVRVVLPKND